jgi:hypothetical protein
VGLPVMDDHRHIKFLREIKLFCKPPELDLLRGEIVKEIESDLSDSDDLILTCEDPKCVIGFGVDPFHFMRMDADSRIDRRVSPGQGHGLFTVGQRGSDRDNRRKPGLCGPFENLFPV